MSQEIIATGRRKTSVARIRMTAGTGTLEVNGRPFDEYFPTLSLQTQVLHPLQVANKANAFDLFIQTHGGGVVGQVGAIRLAIARALIQTDEQLKNPLRAEGLLTRDSRMKERKKSGQPGARKRFQFSKR